MPKKKKNTVRFVTSFGACFKKSLAKGPVTGRWVNGNRGKLGVTLLDFDATSVGIFFFWGGGGFRVGGGGGVEMWRCG